MSMLILLIKVRKQDIFEVGTISHPFKFIRLINVKSFGFCEEIVIALSSRSILLCDNPNLNLSEE